MSFRGVAEMQSSSSPEVEMEVGPFACRYPLCDFT
jgi:hypothetical protein